MRAPVLAFTLAASMAVVPLGAAAIASDRPGDAEVSVRKELDAYHVTATFATPQSAAVARAVLTDYERIPRFMPDVEKSRVLERGERRVVVEQEAVARVMLFSKRVHLVLEIQEDPGAIRFRDRCGRSFARYEGAWTIAETGGGAVIGYELTAKPGFDVPEFLLKRILRRDARAMITRLRDEMTIRAAPVAESPAGHR